MSEPTIYKPSIYKGNGVYKNGAAGGVSPIPPEYKQYDWIYYSGASSTHTWFSCLPVDIDNNENLEMEFTYNAMLDNFDLRKIFQIVQSPGGQYDTTLELQNYYGEYTRFTGYQNGGNYDYSLPTNCPVILSTGKSTLKIKNGSVIYNDNTLFDRPSCYSKTSFYLKYCYLIVPESKKFKSYGGKISKNGVLFYNWVPAEQIATGYRGFYDTVHDTFTHPSANVDQYYTMGND